jgi:TolB-like protein
MKWRKLLSELKRRHVFKSTIAYLAIAWVIIQIASIVLPTFNSSDYAVKIIIYLLSIGFFFWIVFSWHYDLTTDGIQKTDDIDTSKESIKLTNRRLNKVIAGSLSFGVLLLLAISFWAGSNWNDQPISLEMKKVAVIPFVQKTDSVEEAYLETGMTQALIDELSKVDQLTVINQKSTRILTSGFDNTNSLILNVINGIDYFIDGVLERELNMISIHIALRESIDAEPVWQKSYSKDFSEVRVLWADVTADLASQMGIIVKPEDAVLWSGLQPVKPEAYELYLKGKHHMNKSTAADWQRGLVYLQEAIDKNPADPYAHAWLAEAYVGLGHGPDPPPDVFPKALAAAQRAIELDSTIALGWAALSHYHTYFGKDWAMAEYAFERANTLNPNLAYNHYHRSWYLALFGRMNEAIEEHKLAQELDPFTPLHTAWLGNLYRWVGMYEEGLNEVDKVTHMEDNYALGMYIKGTIFIDQGKVEEGLELLKQSSEIRPAWKYHGYGPALIENGYIKEGRAVLKELEAMPINGYRALCMGRMYAYLGYYDKSFEAWNYKDKHGWYPWLRTEQFPNDIKADPRFLKMIRDMNLPDPAPLIYNPE